MQQVWLWQEGRVEGSVAVEPARVELVPPVLADLPVERTAAPRMHAIINRCRFILSTGDLLPQSKRLALASSI